MRKQSVETTSSHVGRERTEFPGRGEYVSISCRFQRMERRQADEKGHVFANRFNFQVSRSCRRLVKFLLRDVYPTVDLLIDSHEKSVSVQHQEIDDKVQFQAS
jgi:hypothetical protein